MNEIPGLCRRSIEREVREQRMQRMEEVSGVINQRLHEWPL